MLDQIIPSCRSVVANSQHVTIHTPSLTKLALKIQDSNYHHFLHSSPSNILDLPTHDIANFLLIYDAIDFSFWGTPKWTILDENSQPIDGGSALFHALFKYFKSQKDIFATLAQISLPEFAQILKGNVEIPLLKNRHQILQEASAIVNKKFTNNFYSQIQQFTTDTDIFNFIIKNFPSFATDTRTYQNQTVRFYKLAQLLTSDLLHLAQIKESKTIDITHLAGCADYKIPQILQALGVLRYSPHLTKLINAQIEIPENDPLETEIRSATIVAIDQIYHQLDGKIPHIYINDLLWHQSRSTNLSTPYHRTRTTSY